MGQASAARVAVGQAAAFVLPAAVAVAPPAAAAVVAAAVAPAAAMVAAAVVVVVVPAAAAVKTVRAPIAVVVERAVEHRASTCTCSRSLSWIR